MITIHFPTIDNLKAFTKLLERCKDLASLDEAGIAQLVEAFASYFEALAEAPKVPVEVKPVEQSDKAQIKSKEQCEQEYREEEIRKKYFEAEKAMKSLAQKLLREVLQHPLDTLDALNDCLPSGRQAAHAVTDKFAKKTATLERLMARRTQSQKFFTLLEARLSEQASSFSFVTKLVIPDQSLAAVYTRFNELAKSFPQQMEFLDGLKLLAQTRLDLECAQSRLSNAKYLCEANQKVKPTGLSSLEDAAIFQAELLKSIENATMEVANKQKQMDENIEELIEDMKQCFAKFSDLAAFVDILNDLSFSSIAFVDSEDLKTTEEGCQSLLNGYFEQLIGIKKEFAKAKEQLKILQIWHQILTGDTNEDYEEQFKKAEGQLDVISHKLGRKQKELDAEVHTRRSQIEEESRLRDFRELRYPVTDSFHDLYVLSNQQTKSKLFGFFSRTKSLKISYSEYQSFYQSNFMPRYEKLIETGQSHSLDYELTQMIDTMEKHRFKKDSAEMRFLEALRNFKQALPLVVSQQVAIAAPRPAK